MNMARITGVALLLGLIVSVQGTGRGQSFNRDIRPLLSDNCFACHGFDAKGRQAGLRLDLRDSAILKADSGRAAIVPGKPDDSELIRRIESTDADIQMPPLGSHRKLTPAQRQTLRKWIAAGAEYEPHWSLVVPRAMTPPAVRKGELLHNPIDTFVLAKLESLDRSFAPEATRSTLLRRVSLDLIGLPPTVDEVAQFLADESPDAYERAVDRLLASPHFGEKLAVDWLDAARYADTNGYFGDKPRQMWLWRDWVINAFNANMPFDQFTIEQLAGDLLSQPSTSQLIATGFNRNHMVNDESGLIDEEYRTEYLVDRVDTTITTWLGLTAGCAQCHDHKYDPISQREFYQLFAFFNNGPDTGLANPKIQAPFLEVPTDEQKLRTATLAEETQAAARAFEPVLEKLNQELSAWEKSSEQHLPSSPSNDVIFFEAFDESRGLVARPVGTTLSLVPGLRGTCGKFNATQHAECDPASFRADGPWSIGLWIHPEGSLSGVFSKIEPEGRRTGLELIWQKGNLRTNLVHEWGVNAIEVNATGNTTKRQWQFVTITYDGSQKASGLAIYLDGAPLKTEVHRDSLTGSIATSEPLRIGRRDSGLGFYGHIDEFRILGNAVSLSVVQDWYWSDRLKGILAIDPGKRTAADRDILLDYYLERSADASAKALRQRVKQAQLNEIAHRASIATTLVMKDNDKPRRTSVLLRGQYDKPGDEVSAGVPVSIGRWPAGAPRNRLGLAQWLTSVENPLTARVAVNRFWQQCFGAGLVRTPNDFGSQGDAPTHPELLDWLASQFRDGGWDVKRLFRLIVTSRTYRQDSSWSPNDPDPENRLLARGPCFRLSAEAVRDQALRASGLLVEDVGGPSVKPYQPEGLWEVVSYNGEETYVPDTGAGLWRRSIYTYVKRQAPPPSLLLFDGPTREKCSVRRLRTNTPLQALLLLNDATYVEAARVCAADIMGKHSTDDARIDQIWLRVLSRLPRERECQLVKGQLNDLRHQFAKFPRQAKELLATGSAVVKDGIEPRELATWTVVVHSVFNLDEAISRR